MSKITKAPIKYLPSLLPTGGEQTDKEHDEWLIKNYRNAYTFLSNQPSKDITSDEEFLHWYYETW